MIYQKGGDDEKDRFCIYRGFDSRQRRYIVRARSVVHNNANLRRR
jgi:hypothetical protein